MELVNPLDTVIRLRQELRKTKETAEQEYGRTDVSFERVYELESLIATYSLCAEIRRTTKILSELKQK